jgi:hypothetical protein
MCVSSGSLALVRRLPERLDTLCHDADRGYDMILCCSAISLTRWSCDPLLPTYHWSLDYTTNAQSEDNNNLSRFSLPPRPRERAYRTLLCSSWGRSDVHVPCPPSGFIERDLSPSGGTIPPGLISISNRLFLGEILRSGFAITVPFAQANLKVLDSLAPTSQRFPSWG